MWVHLRVFRASLVTVWIQYSLFLVSSWECLEIGLGLSIGRITFRLVALVCVFHSISLACFLPRAFVIISWLGTPLHFVVTHSILWDMFTDHLFILYTYHGLSTSSFVWSLVRFSTRCSYFHYRKVKDTFSYSHIFREIRLDHLITFFFSWSSSWRLSQGYFGLDWVSISW